MKRKCSAPKELPKDGFVRIETVLELIPVSRSTWFAGIAAGRYPRPVALAPRIKAYRVEDIRRLLEGFGP